MFYGYFQVNNYLNNTIMNTIEEKIEKGKKIATIINDIEQLTSISDTLNKCYINVNISTNTSGNLLHRNKVFDNIVWKHIDEIKTDVTKAIDSLEKELDLIIK